MPYALPSRSRISAGWQELPQLGCSHRPSFQPVCASLYAALFSRWRRRSFSGTSLRPQSPPRSFISTNRYT